MDASKAGEGQLEISINDGDVPNAVQVLGGGKCLVTYTPEQPITHEIEVTFNGEQVAGETRGCVRAFGAEKLRVRVQRIVVEIIIIDYLW